jgi:hypothetical protein
MLIVHLLMDWLFERLVYDFLILTEYRDDGAFGCAVLRPYGRRGWKRRRRGWRWRGCVQSWRQRSGASMRLKGIGMFPFCAQPFELCLFVCDVIHWNKSAALLLKCFSLTSQFDFWGESIWAAVNYRVRKNSFHIQPKWSTGLSLNSRAIKIWNGHSETK